MYHATNEWSADSTAWYNSIGTYCVCVCVHSMVTFIYKQCLRVYACSCWCLYTCSFVCSLFVSTISMLCATWSATAIHAHYTYDPERKNTDTIAHTHVHWFVFSYLDISRYNLNTSLLRHLLPCTQNIYFDWRLLTIVLIVCRQASIQCTVCHVIYVLLQTQLLYKSYAVE